MGLSTIEGRGIFAGEDLSKGSLIELAPVIVLNPRDTKIIHKTHLHDYYFSWGDDAKQSAICLGYGSLYNHHANPNANYEMDFDFMTISFYAKRDIITGEEITIDYNAEDSEAQKLWFE